VKAFLQNLGYVLDQQKNIWIRQNYTGINYSDGEEIELRLDKIIEKASDITVLSSELRQHCTDWPSLYHLSGTRANILRPFADSLTGDILEIGAGCGAITRYLGECGGNVLALEGSPRRAAIARSRTRDLKNVTVLAEKFDEFQCDHQFDVVTLIGVLEYANLFTPGESPALAMLERLRSLLKPEGKLIIAIENQLGLKYFAGAPEDHLGQPMYGIEGRYQTDQPQTFGRAVLADMIKQAGFTASEFLSPLPDYKLPISILTEEGIKSKDFDAAAFAWQSARRDPQLPPYCNFSLELAWPEVFKNGIALDTANSFLIVASPEAQQLVEPGILAYHYSTDRLAAYCKETLFRRANANDIGIQYKRLGRTHKTSDNDNNPLIKFVCPDSDKYVFGNPLSLDFVRIVTKDGWSVEEVARFIWRYLTILEGFAKERGMRFDTESPHSKLSGTLFDVVPQNIIIHQDGSASLIDREWELVADIELGHLLFRSLLLLLSQVTRFGRSKSGSVMVRKQFVKTVFATLGLEISDENLLRYIQTETAIQERITGRSAAECLSWGAENALPAHSLNQAVVERDGQIASLNQAVAERDGQIAGLNQAVAERGSQIAGLNLTVTQREDALALSRLEFSSVLESNSWKLTAPLRRLKSGTHLLLTRSRVLLLRSAFVLRQKGVFGFVRRTIGFIGRYRQRKLAERQLERFVVDAGATGLARDVPLVSFVIPTYDRTDLLRTAVKSALGQTLQVFEVILITDGSPPATMAVVEEFSSDPRVSIFNYPVSSGNAVRGRNKGILEARGRYIAFLDSDDIAAPDRLEVCLPILESGKADVVYGAWRALFDGTREVDRLAHGQEVHSPDCDLAMLEKICVPCQSTVMVRRDMLLRTGFLKPRMQYREDHELWARLAYHGAQFKSVPHVLTDLRLHAGNNELNFKGNDSYWETLFREEYRLPGPRPRKIAFLLAGLGISGGVAVVLKHVSLLMEEGHDAFVIDLGGHGDIAWFGNPAIRVYQMEEMARCRLDNIDLLFATFWTTVEWLEKIPARRKLYLVQSDERLFYEADALKAQVADTYRRSYEYIAIARWLIDLLRNEFGQLATYVPNGLDSGLFYPDEPLVAKNSQRPRVLIEGPISVPFKGMADAYAAVSTLDCELWIVSSDGRPERSWRYDRFFEGVNQVEMRRIYSSCDVLLQMSRVESFAYPPLEAMACGCAVVVGDVSGGIEYARDGENVLKVPQGDVAAARAAVLKLLTSTELRGRLMEAGFATAKCWSWESSREAMLGLVESAERS